jgi:plastocyanin
MNKNILGATVAIIAIIGIIGVVLANKSDSPGQNTTSNATQTDMSNMNMDSTTEPQSGTGEEDLTGQTEVALDIKDFEFSKKNIKISKGTKVTWTNRDRDRHNAFSETDGGPKGDLLGQGQTYDFTFDKVGTFNYKCEPHPYMKGAVNVVEKT